MQIEICLDSVESAVAAQQGGADRVELCDNLVQGGTTPSLGMIERVRETIDLELMVIVRPRGGDFLYSNNEFGVMKRNVKMLYLLGVDGAVFGLLNADGTVDRERTAELVKTAKTRPKPLTVTFHRAFDMARDPFEALDTLLELGVDRILTSGQAANAMAGADLIGRLQQHAGEQAIILPAVGINARNAAELVRLTKVRELHIGSAVRERIRSQMIYKNHLAKMGADDAQSEYDLIRTSAAKVRELVTAVQED